MQTIRYITCAAVACRLDWRSREVFKVCVPSHDLVLCGDVRGIKLRVRIIQEQSHGHFCVASPLVVSVEWMHPAWSQHGLSARVIRIAITMQKCTHRALIARTQGCNNTTQSRADCANMCARVRGDFFHVVCALSVSCAACAAMFAGAFARARPLCGRDSVHTHKVICGHTHFYRRRYTHTHAHTANTRDLRTRALFMRVPKHTIKVCLCVCLGFLWHVLYLPSSHTHTLKALKVDPY